MLSKVPTKRNDGKSSFKSLQKYIEGRDIIDSETGEITGWERDSVSIETNCLDRDTAWREMLAVADMNGRVKDPVYHAVISWQNDEKPTNIQAFEACREAMKAIGMQGHQFIAAVHRDTDNHHVHLMVNRVNPETYKAVYPDRDYYKLDRTMREIELNQGWKHDNGPFSVHERDGKKVVDWAKSSAKEYRKEQVDKRISRPTKVKDMERHTGNESLYSYTQVEPKNDAKSVLQKPDASWQSLHRVLAKHGLELRPTSDKMNAFRVHSTSDPKICIKASSMELGGGKLIKQLGPYEPIETRYFDRDAEQNQTYSKHRPLRDPAKRMENREKRAKERAELRDKYDGFVVEWKATKAPAKAELANSQKLRRKSLTDQHKAEREAIRRSGLDANHRKALTSVAAFTVAAKRDELKDIIKAENGGFRKEKQPSYRDWVADRAEAGDPAAIAQLRGFAHAEKRKGKHPQEPDIADIQRPYFAATSDSDLDPARPARLSERVTWAVDRSTGAVNYSVNDRLAFRDEGRRITFNKDSRNDADSIEVGLLLAKEKFGAVAVHGGQEFRDRVLATAVERRLDVRFADPELEQQRKDGIKADIDHKRQRFVEDQKQVGVIPAQQVAKKAPQQPAMTRDEAQQALSAPTPVRPFRDYVELDAVDADVAQYRSQLDRTHRESWGERADPEKASGFIGRHMAKGKAMQWDKDFEKNVIRPTEARRKHLDSNHPDAVKFRDDAWNKAVKNHDSSVNNWTEKRDNAKQTLIDLSRQDDQRAERHDEAQRLQQRQDEQDRERKIFNEKKRRIDALPDMLKRSDGADYLFAEKALTAIKEKMGQWEKVDWDSVEKGTLLEAGQKPHRPVHEAFESALKYSPAHADKTPEDVKYMLERVDEIVSASGQNDTEPTRQAEAQRLQQRLEEQERERENSCNRDTPDFDM